MKTKKAYLMILMSALSVLNAYSQLPSYVPTNGLIGSWPFNGNANDESGNGNNGTVNGATLTADRNGLANNAYNFNGLQNILVQHNNSFNMGYNFSISVWFTVNDFNKVRTLINKNSIGEGKLDYFNIGILPSTGTLYTQFGNGNLIDNIISPNIPNLNVWYNAIFTVDDSVKLFVNGQLIEKHWRTITPLENTEKISFGYWQNQSHTYHNGKLDDIGIWNRALTQQEITSLYAGCNDETATTNSLNGIVLKNSQPINLTASPSLGGQFSGDAITNNKFTPADAHLGKNTVHYNFTNSTGCQDSTDFSVIVYDTLGNVCSTYDT